jgi:hypothetical protein
MKNTQPFEIEKAGSPRCHLLIDDRIKAVLLAASFIPSFFEIKESAGA